MSDHVHAKYLRRLTHQIAEAGIDPSSIEFSLIEPDWFNDQGQPQSLCDMIIGLKNGYVIPLELKADAVKKAKAVEQIVQGVHFANQVLHRPVFYGVFMVYDSKRNLYHPPTKIIDELPQQSLPDLNYTIDTML